jgi:hypothetical protein
MIQTGETRRTRRKTCPSATLSATNPTWTYPNANPGIRGERPAINCLNPGTANPKITWGYSGKGRPEREAQHSSFGSGRLFDCWTIERKSRKTRRKSKKDVKTKEVRKEEIQCTLLNSMFGLLSFDGQRLTVTGRSLCGRKMFSRHFTP